MKKSVTAENWSCDQREQQNTPLFLKRGEGLGEGKPGADVRLFSREKKFFLSPIKPFTLTVYYWEGLPGAYKNITVSQ